jgi:hypothetical protein
MKPVAIVITSSTRRSQGHITEGQTDRPPIPRKEAS